MAVLTKLMLAVFYIQVLLTVFGIAAVPGGALFTFLTNPTDWNNSLFGSMISDLALTLGGIAIIAGTFLVKSDIIVFAGMAGVLYSFGKPLVNLFTLVSAQTNEIVGWLFVSPLILLYVMTVVAWWRGRD